MDKFEIVKGLLERDRSVRRFEENRRISRETLERLIDLTRYCASGRNLQPLKYRIVTDKEECERVFPLLAWAGYFENWSGPEEGERPVAYIVQCLDSRLTKNCLCDDGLQLQAITLGATSLNIGGCIIKSFQIMPLKEVLNLPEWTQPLYVLALGYSKEKVQIEILEVETPESIKYYRTPDGMHHVPKRPLESLLI